MHCIFFFPIMAEFGVSISWILVIDRARLKRFELSDLNLSAAAREANREIELQRSSKLRIRRSEH